MFTFEAKPLLNSNFVGEHSASWELNGYIQYTLLWRQNIYFVFVVTTV
jgi:hypothetical protein